MGDTVMEIMLSRRIMVQARIKNSMLINTIMSPWLSRLPLGV
jgi:hypothetical protein